MTAPGTTLSVGDPATVETTSLGGRTATVTLTVSDIEQGSADDFDPSQADSLDGGTPYYIKFTITGGAGSDGLASDQLDGSAVYGVQDDGNAAAWLDIYGDFAKCPNADFPDSFGPGQQAEQCFPVVAAKGSTVGAAAWGQSGTPYSTTDGKPLIWKQ